MSDEKKPFDEWKTESGAFFLYLSENKTECWLDVKPSKLELSFSDEDLLLALHERGVTSGLDRHALLSCCKDMSVNKPVEELLIASGTPPTLGQDERLDFFVKISTDTPEYDEEKGGEVDFHHANLFENVSKGQVIAARLPADPGQMGISVFGHPVPVPDHEPLPLLSLGMGVVWRNETECVATLDGRVIFEEGHVSITDQLEIRGDVDYECGDIDFVGYVHVCGSVHSGFNVRAGKGLSVEHEVEQCCVESDGDIELGGMSGGDGGGTIVCGGNLTAKYLHDTSVECSGEVSIKNEVINCEVHSLGVICVSGLIAGGMTVARMGIEVGRLGTDAEVRTVLTAGVDYRILDELKKPMEKLRSIQEEQDTFSRLFEEECSDGSDREIWEERVRELYHQQCEWQSVLQDIHHRYGGTSNAKINVKRCIFEGVVLRLGQVKEKMDEYRSGECSIIEHRSCSLAFLPWSPLSKSARELEAALILQENEAEEGA